MVFIMTVLPVVRYIFIALALSLDCSYVYSMHWHWFSRSSEQFSRVPEICCICLDGIDTNSPNHSAPQEWLDCINHNKQCHKECLRLALERDGRCPLCRTPTPAYLFKRSQIRRRAPSLEEAISQHDDEALRLWLEDSPEAVNHPQVTGDTPLIHAVNTSPSTRTIHLLLYHQAAIDHQNNQGETALIRAAALGHNEIVGYLLDQGAHLHATTISGQTALDCAHAAGHTDTAHLLHSYAISSRVTRQFNMLTRRNKLIQALFLVSTCIGATAVPLILVSTQSL